MTERAPSFFERRPVLTYYILAFAISWGGILLAVGPGGIPGIPGQMEKMIPVVMVAMLAGPSLASILMTGVVDGRVGYRVLLSRLLRWRVSIGWYAAALLITPLLMMAMPLLLSRFDPSFLPHVISEDKASVLRMGLTAGVLVGICEELGWTGFVIPRLRLRLGTLTTGLIVGVLWGTWHVLLNVWTSGTPSGAFSLPFFLGALIFSFGLLPAYRILMVCVYDQTGSLLIAMLMHFSLVACTIIVPKTITGTSGPIWTGAVSATLWIIVAGTTVATRRKMTQASGATRGLVGSYH